MKIRLRNYQFDYATDYATKNKNTAIYQVKLRKLRNYALLFSVGGVRVSNKYIYK